MCTILDYVDAKCLGYEVITETFHSPHPITYELEVDKLEVDKVLSDHPDLSDLNAYLTSVYGDSEL